MKFRIIMYQQLLLLFLILAIGAFGEDPSLIAEQPIEVIVSANRGYAQDPLDISQSISVATHEALNKDSVYYNLEEALREFPNIGFGQATQSFSSHQGGNTSSNYWQQGFTIRGLGNARVLVLTDGIRQSGQGIGYGGGNLSLYDMPAIERVEVLRGPYSVLYGTDALGGVVNIISKEPVFSKEKDMSFGSRISFDGSRRLWRRSVTMDVSSPNHAITLGATDTQANRPKAPKGTIIDNGAFQSHGFWMKSLHQLTPNSQLKLLANSTQVEDIEIANREVIKTMAKPGKPATYMKTPLGITIPHYRRTVFGAEWCLREYSDTLEQAKVAFYWQQLRRRFAWEAPAFGPKTKGFPEQSSYRLTHDKGNTLELQPMMVLSLSDHTLTGGIDLGYDDVKLTSQRQDESLDGKLVLENQTVDGNAYQLRSGIYLQDRIDLYPLEITIGGRFDNFYVKSRSLQSGKSQSGLSGSLSFLGHLNDTTSLYTTLAAGYRAPDLGERFQDTVIVLHKEMNVLGNPNLRPETSQSIEFGLKHRSDQFKAEAAVFLNDIRHYIGTKPDPLNAFKYQYQNLGDLVLYGVEAEVTWTPIKHWDLFAGVGRTYTNKKNLVTLPSWMSHFGTSYEYETRGSILKSIKPMIKGTAFAGSQDTMNKAYLPDGAGPFAVAYPGFLVWDAQVSFAFKTASRLEGDLTIGVKNCFNKTHYMPFFGNPSLKMNPQPARGFFMTASINF